MFSYPIFLSSYMIITSCTFEELEEIKPPYDALVLYLLELYQKKEKRQILNYE